MGMDKKYLLAGLILTLVLIAGWQATLQPGIALKDVSFSDLSLAAINADLVFDVTNPYLLGGILSSLDLSVYGGTGENRFLIADVHRDSLSLPAMQTTPVTIPVSIRTTGIGRSTLALLIDQKLPVQVTGTALVNILGIPVPVPVNETRVVERDGFNVTLQ